MARHQPYFKILGLDEPPKDRKAVKRAYSQQLKLTRPDEDPEGFMRLRDAHDIALQIVAQQAEIADAKAEAEAGVTLGQEEPPLPNKPASVTYKDMIPEPAETPSPTSYSIGPTPSLDAPHHFDTQDTPSRKDPPAEVKPPLLDDVLSLLESPERYNDREGWNHLFRAARQLDIDDYVDFEGLLMHLILRFHGFYDDLGEAFNQPEKLPQKLSPSIAASLFKTMNWDKVGKMSYEQTQQIEWLNRRMHISKPSLNTIGENMPPASAPTALGRWFWPMLGLVMALALLADLLTS